MIKNFSFMLLDDAAATQQTAGIGSILSLLVPLLLLGVVFYFFIYRPQKKQEKETTDMRNSIEIGDVVVTTGGIIGTVVKIKDDMLLIESSGNRTKIQIQKWAVHKIMEKANEAFSDSNDK